ncbi:MAG: threonine synthase, partial [Snodgrassella sp.]|nr:threonine synthase [Snodgrassella sp.]
FAAGKSTHADRMQTIAQVYAEDNQLIDPHTADGVKVARQLREAGEIIICLETAQAAKFAQTIHEAVGNSVEIPRPDNLAGLEDLPQHVTVMDNDPAAVKQFVEAQLGE